MKNITRTIWMYWHQGWQQAPEIPRKCLQSWISRNPGWEVRALDQQTLANYIDLPEIIPGFTEKKITLASLSDIIRISLLHKYGGVWADSTVLCRFPLDNWIGRLDGHDFFAFSMNMENRIISSWFLMAANDSYIIRKWYQQMVDFWNERDQTDEYLWLHRLFSVIYAADPPCRDLWDATPPSSARPAHFFSPYPDRLFMRLTDKLLHEVKRLDTPVFKLTHKYDPDQPLDGTLVDYLFSHVVEPRALKILVAWYGSFDRQGTIGDYLSVKVLLDFLTRMKYDFHCASQKIYPGLKGKAVRLEEVNPGDYQMLLFCCGPISKGHRKLDMLFGMFPDHKKVGVAVSLFPEGHPNHFNPFDVALCRENGDQDYDDLAILDNTGSNASPGRNSFTVGLVMRGKQSEYGPENCLDEEALEAARKLARNLMGQRMPLAGKLLKMVSGKLQGLNIDNHLANAGDKPESVITLYKKCNIIITTRFHGTIISLKYGVPVIALDQIKGGGKVSKLIGRMGYPYLFRADSSDDRVLKNAAVKLLGEDFQSLTAPIVEKARKGAMHALSTLEDALNELEGF